MAIDGRDHMVRHPARSCAAAPGDECRGGRPEPWADAALMPRSRLTRTGPGLRVRRSGRLSLDDDERRRAQPRAILPGPDPDPAAVLGRARLRHPPAL